MNIDDIIDLLNDAARELLTEAESLEAAIEKASDKPEALKKHLVQLCSILSRILTHLEDQDSPLRELVRRIGGVKVCDTIDKLRKYLDEHRAAFEKLGIPKEMLEQAIDSLETSAKFGDEDALEKPQTVTVDDVIKPIREFRDLVCEISRSIEIAMNPVEIARQVVKGAIGTATVVVDVTAGIKAAPFDPFGWVMLKAVKSIWSGVRKVKSAVSNIREMIRRK